MRVGEKGFVWAWGDWYPATVESVARTRATVAYATRQGRKARTKKVRIDGDEWATGQRPRLGPESWRVKAEAREQARKAERAAILNELGEPWGEPVEEYSLRGEMTKNLLKWAAGSSIFCKGCERTMDWRRTVILETSKRTVVRCSKCFEATYRPMLVQAGERANAIEVTDGRHFI